MDFQEYFNKVLNLLHLEWEEDRRQYQDKVMRTSLKERVNQGVCWYPVVVKRSYLGMGEKMVVEIERTEKRRQPHALTSGSSVNLFVNSGDSGQHAAGVISYLREDIMKIILNKDDMPEWIDKGRLGVNLLFDESTYEEMKLSLKRMKSIEEGRIKELRDVIFGLTAPSFNQKAISVEINNLNNRQNEALQLIQSAQDIAIVHGPPGTGKTTTLVESIIKTLEIQQQVLVTAPSNAAVDLIVEKLTLKNVSVVRIGHPARVTEEVLNNTLDSKIAHHESYRDLKKARKKSEELKKLAFKYKRKYGRQERAQRRLLFEEAGRVRIEAEMLESYIINQLLSSAQVVACTLIGANNGLLRGKQFQTVFIDEASQAMEPACWIPVFKSKRIVMAGDHFQLPPTIKSLDAAKQGLSTTLFERAIKNKNCSTMLDEQYRMHEEIMLFSSKYFYYNQLKAASIIQERQPLASPPIVFIDLAGSGYTEDYDKNLSTYNLEEAKFVLAHLNRQVEVMEGKAIDFTASIITPYKAQVEVFRGLLPGYPALLALNSQFSVNTVDSFQGQEKDIIYISLVRSNKDGEIGFLKDIRRTNVALTRAKHQLVVVGDSATLSTHDFYARLVDHFQKRDAYKSVFELQHITR